MSKKRGLRTRRRSLSAAWDSSKVSDDMLSSMGLTRSAYEALSAFTRLEGNAKTRRAREIIQEMIIDAKALPDASVAFAVDESESLLSGYTTLDEPHRNEIRGLKKQIENYLNDSTRKRPLNALMLASPGAGKSYFIKQLAASMKDLRVQAVTFNMATMRSADDMAQPIDELRNLKVNDQFPLLFLDEFDSDASRYAALLPLLWDGELHLGHRDLKLGKAVIVLAGSNPDLPKAMDRSASMTANSDPSEPHVPAGKLIDLLSRINGGVIQIPDLDLRTTSRDRRVDKVCATIALAKGRFGKTLAEVPRALLQLVAQTQFRYGVRSIAHLIDVIDPIAFSDGKLSLGRLGLPVGDESKLRESSLRLHILDKDQAYGVVSRWNLLTKDKAVVPLNKPYLRFPFFKHLF